MSGVKVSWRSRVAQLRFLFLLLLSFTLYTGSTGGTVKVSGRSHVWPQGQWEVTRVASRSVVGHMHGVKVSGRCKGQILITVVCCTGVGL